METEIARHNTWDFLLFVNKVLLLQRLTQRVVQNAAAGGILIIHLKKKVYIYSAAFLFGFIKNIYIRKYWSLYIIIFYILKYSIIYKACTNIYSQEK